MAEHFLYLTTTGRTSGLPRQIEIWFVEHSGRHYIVSERRDDSGWVKNLTRCPQVQFSVGDREAPEAFRSRTPAQARIVDAATETALVQTIQTLMNRKYGWSDGLIVELAEAVA